MKAGFIFVIVTLAVDINDGENEKMTNTFLIVDGNSLMHRAFHALPLMDADGVYTNAIYGFLSMLLKAVKEEEAAYLAICFDEHGPTFRHQIYAEYKAGRAATPPSSGSSLILYGSCWMIWESEDTDSRDGKRMIC